MLQYMLQSEDDVDDLDDIQKKCNHQYSLQICGTPILKFVFLLSF